MGGTLISRHPLNRLQTTTAVYIEDGAYITEVFCIFNLLFIFDACMTTLTRKYTTNYKLDSLNLSNKSSASGTFSLALLPVLMHIVLSIVFIHCWWWLPAAL